MSIILKIQNLAGETLDTIIELLTDQERNECIEIVQAENQGERLSLRDSVDFILNVM